MMVISLFFFTLSSLDVNQIGNMDEAHEMLDNMDRAVGSDSVLKIELANVRLN